MTLEYFAGTGISTTSWGVTVFHIHGKTLETWTGDVNILSKINYLIEAAYLYGKAERSRELRCLLDYSSPMHPYKNK